MNICLIGSGRCGKTSRLVSLAVKDHEKGTRVLLTAGCKESANCLGPGIRPFSRYELDTLCNYYDAIYIDDATFLTDVEWDYLMMECKLRLVMTMDPFTFSTRHTVRGFRYSLLMLPCWERVFLNTSFDHTPYVQTQFESFRSEQMEPLDDVFQQCYTSSLIHNQFSFKRKLCLNMHEKYACLQAKIKRENLLFKEYIAHDNPMLNQYSADSVLPEKLYLFLGARVQLLSHSIKNVNHGSIGTVVGLEPCKVLFNNQQVVISPVTEKMPFKQTSLYYPPSQPSLQDLCILFQKNPSLPNTHLETKLDYNEQTLDKEQCLQKNDSSTHASRTQLPLRNIDYVTPHDLIGSILLPTEVLIVKKNHASHHEYVNLMYFLLSRVPSPTNLACAMPFSTQLSRVKDDDERHQLYNS